MSHQQQGRFGKYGDLKRKEKIRENRLMKQGQARHLVAIGRAEAHRYPGSENKK